MAQPLTLPYTQIVDANGAPIAGAKIYTYAAGTTTPQASYTDSTGTVAAANPVICDSAGRATVWLSGYYRIVVKDASDNTISTTDNVTALGATGDMNKSVYDAANIQEQLVGLTAVQTLTNKSIAIVGVTTNSDAASGIVGEYLSTMSSSASATITVTIASPGVVTWTAHGLTGIVPVVFTTSGALPTGITAGTVYWTIASTVTTNTFQIATTIANAVAGTAINTSGSQSGTHTGTMGATITTSTATDCGAISLTAGDYDVWGSIRYKPTGLATVYTSGVGTNSNTLPTDTLYTLLNGITFASAAQQVVVSPVQRIKLASTSTVYLTAFATFSTGAMTASGSIFARRRR